jgi:hypothetical protein
MKTNIAALAAIIGLIAGVVTLGLASTSSSASAEGPELPGMCNGPSDANVVLIAHANGKPVEVPKYILNLYTDATGKPFGTLVLGQGKDRLQVTDWCRLWMHQPNDTPQGGGQCEGEDDGHDPDALGAITGHAVGIGWKNGQQVLVRTDVRSNEEGMFFRVRYRAMGEHHDGDEGHVGAAAHEDEEDCEGGGWTRVPAEHGWAPLKQLMVR